MTKTPFMSTREYLDTPESSLPTELIYGALRVADSPMPRHQAAVADFFTALDNHVREDKLGKVWFAPLDVILDARRALILQPDLLFISNERSGILTDRIYGAPDMVLEVLSPNPRIGRLEERVQWFAEYGVRECWVLHHEERSIDVLSLDRRGIVVRDTFDEGTPIRSSVFPGFLRSVGSILTWNG
ncbi:MAG: Uma2 family endonuclease [Vicinamibacterales bacterium]|nr:Uma2 family endonuclease [Vicinamibacterales bacterium]